MSGLTGKWFRGLQAICALFMLVQLSSPARANHAPGSMHLIPCVLPAAPGMTAPALLDTPERFDCSGRQTRYGGGDFWVSMQDFAAQDSHGDPLVLITGSVWQDRVSLHVRYGDGVIVALPPVTSRQTSQHLQLGALIQYDIPPRATPVTAILAFVEGSANVRGVLLAPRLQPRSLTTASNLELSALYAGFIGLCLALLCYNLALWSALRHHFQLAYCGMVLAIMVYAISSSGALAWAFPEIDNNSRLQINYLSLSCACVGALAFMRRFFEAGAIPAWLARVLDVCAGLNVGAMLPLALFAPWQIALFDRLYTLSFITMFLGVVAIVISAWRRQSPFLGLFVLAWSAPVIGGLLRALHTLGLIGYSFWLDNSTILAMAAEALLSAIAIAYRIRLVSEERDRARISESIARAEADTDPLTGLLNRRAFLSAAINSVDRQRLLLIDIDHFKQVNDRIGHDGGDEVLRIFARVIRTTAGTEAVVARLGGEEFGLLVPADRARFIDPARLLGDIRASDLEFGMTVTASIGLAEGEIDCEDDWRALYRQADSALYRAKAEGRDRVCAIAPVAQAA